MHLRTMMHPFTYTICAPRLVGGEQEPLADLECVAAIVADPADGPNEWTVDTLTAETWIRNDNRPANSPDSYTLVHTVIGPEHYLYQPIIDWLYGDAEPDITEAWAQYVNEDHREYDSHAA